MTTKIFDLNEDFEGEIFETLAAMSQPLFLYYYNDVIDNDYLIVSDVEIAEDDVENVAENLIQENFPENNKKGSIDGREWGDEREDYDGDHY